RKKAQFDEGSGTVGALRQALQILTGAEGEIEQEREGALYREILHRRFGDPGMILSQAGQWNADRVAA
ncbi:hypothetical protein L2D77_33100, partial [Pseudomonas aeruginosa]|uniref:hypothetical protein n=1 Tax=Pseudomonas aeruginosa TaxID=287 RepID=UPI001F27054D